MVIELPKLLLEDEVVELNRKFETFGDNFIERIELILKGPCFGNMDSFKESYVIKPDGSVTVKTTHEGKTDKKVYKNLGPNDYLNLVEAVLDLRKEANFHNLIIDDCARTVKIRYLYNHTETMDGCYGTKDCSINDLICDYLAQAKVEGFELDE